MAGKDELSFDRRRMAGSVGDSGVRKVLLVIPEASTAGLVARGLHAGNLIPTLAFTEEQATRCLRLDVFSLVIVALGGGINLATLAAAVRDADVPLILVGGSPSELILPVGFEQHLPGIPAAEEIVARAVVVATLQRAVELPALRWGALELDVKRRLAYWEGSPLRLTVTEFRIMEVLALATGCVVSVDALVRRVWRCESFDEAKRVIAHIRRIRKKIEPEPSRPVFLLTVRGEGFRLRGDDEWGSTLGSAEKELIAAAI